MMVANADTPNLILNERQVNYNCNEILFPALKLAKIKRFRNVLQGYGFREKSFLPSHTIGGNVSQYDLHRGQFGNICQI